MKQAIEAVKSKTSTFRKATIGLSIPCEALRRRCKIDLPEQHPDLCEKLGRFNPVLNILTKKMNLRNMFTKWKFLVMA